MSTPREAIEKIIPHRGPMLLVDEIVEQSEQRIHCRKTFRPEEFFVQGHYPGFPLVPGVILCETALQAGAILLARHTPRDGNQVPVVTRLSEVKFKQMVRPGDTVEIQAELTEQLGGAFFLRGKVTVGGKLAARLEFACAMAEREGAEREGAEREATGTGAAERGAG